MKKTKDFNEFLMDLMLEKDKPKFHGVTELPFVLSARLKRLLSSIKHPIAKKLIEIDKAREDKKLTFVDLSEEAENKFSLVNSNKAYDNFIKSFNDLELDVNPKDVKQKMDDMPNFDHDYDSPLWSKNRAEVKIGSFVGKVFPKEFQQGGNPGNDIESFVQAIIAKRKSNESGDDRFKIVKGEEIKKYYYQGNYDVKNADDDTNVHGSPLAGSCMRYDYCEDYVDFYAQNTGASMLILFSDVDGREEKIVGRAIIWELAQPSGRTFMDRIYYRYESDMAMFKQYAEKQGWLYKSQQNMSATSDIVDTRSGESKIRDMKTKPNFKTTSKYPYMDTMKWFNVEKGYLTNDRDETDSGYDVYFLEDTSGGYEDRNGDDDRIYIEFYDDSYDEEDLIYCELGQEYRLPDDAVYIESYDNYATQDYADDHFRWSDYDGQYLHDDDAIYSKYHDDYINSEDTITMSLWADQDFDEIREDDDDIRTINDIGGNVIEYQGPDKEWYYFDKDDYDEYFVEVDKTSSTHHGKGWKHKVWDKDKIYRHDGKWHYEYDPKVRDKITGQKRLWEE